MPLSTSPGQPSRPRRWSQRPLAIRNAAARAVSSSDRVLSRCSVGGLVGFVAVFPGFFLYQAAVAQGMPAFLRGYSVAVASLVVPLVALGYARMVATGAVIVWFDAFFIGFVAYLLGSIVVQGLLGTRQEVVTAHLGSIPQWLALYGIARTTDPSERRFRALLYLAWLTMTVVVLTNVSEVSLLVVALDTRVDDRDYLANYQDFALLYLTVSLACLVYAQSRWAQSLLIAVTAIVLFLNGARSEFLGWFVAALIVGWCTSRHRAVLVLCVAALSLALMASIDPLTTMLPDNRVVDLIENHAESSLAQRREMTRHAWATIGDHPLTGEFGSYAPGEYAHNLLSVWVDLGLLGLVWFCLLLALPLLDLGTRFSRCAAREPRCLLVAVFLVLSLLLLLSAKMFTYNLLPFALGLYAHYLAIRMQTKGRKRKP